MNSALATAPSIEVGTQDFLTINIAEQRFGIPILQIQDVLGDQTVTTIPLAPAEVAGSLNLRGRVVTAIDVRRRLGLERREDNASYKSMGVVVEHHEELYSLIIDKVGDVLKLKDDAFENTPPTLDPLWKNISSGIYRLNNDLLIILDIPKLLGNVEE